MSAPADQEHEQVPDQEKPKPKRAKQSPEVTQRVYFRRRWWPYTMCKVRDALRLPGPGSPTHAELLGAFALCLAAGDAVPPAKLSATDRQNAELGSLLLDLARRHPVAAPAVMVTPPASPTKVKRKKRDRAASPAPTEPTEPTEAKKDDVVDVPKPAKRARAKKAKAEAAPAIPADTEVIDVDAD